MVVVIKKKLKKGQLDAALKQLRKSKRKGASILRFVGKVSFQGDPVAIQKEMRRER